MVKRPGTADHARPSAGQRHSTDVHLELEFEDPALLTQLFGQFDRNLIALENRLGVYIAARGNRVIVEGDGAEAEQARDALNLLYARLQQGLPVEPGDVAAALTAVAEHAAGGSAEGASADSAMTTIRTRRKSIAARNAAQAK